VVADSSVPDREIARFVRALFLILCVLTSFNSRLDCQTTILCADEHLSFEEFQPILYPYFSRRAGAYTDFDIALTMFLRGKLEYKLLNPLDERLVGYELQRAIETALPGWKFENNTNETASVRLKVVFELSGSSPISDDKVINRIAFDRNSIVIRVIATRIIPNLVAD
jgi:hypothetical protein